MILKSELQMWFNAKKKNEKRDFTTWVIFISIFVKKKMEIRTYFVYFHTFSYKFKVPTNFHRVWAACGLRSESSLADHVWAPPPISRIMSTWPCPDIQFRALGLRSRPLYKSMITFNWAHHPKFSGIDNLKGDFLFLVDRQKYNMSHYN